MSQGRITLHADSLTTEQVRRGILEHRRIVMDDPTIPKGITTTDSRDAKGAPFVGLNGGEHWTLVSVGLRPDQAARLSLAIYSDDPVSVAPTTWDKDYGMGKVA